MSTYSSTSEGNGRAGVKRPGLKRSMGLWMATALVVGNMIGSGIFLLPAAMAGTAGPVSIVAWLFTGIGAMLLALVFATLGRAYPKTGGPYVYARKAFGDFIGFQTAWSYWINAWVGNAAIAIAFAGYLAVFWGDASRTGSRARRHLAHLDPHARQHPRRARGRDRPGRDDNPQVRPAARDRRGRPVLHGQLGNFEPFTLSSGFDWGISAAALADPLGLHRPGIGDRPCRGGQGSRADHPAADRDRHGRDDRSST